jgi:hypothetical protein
MRVVPGQVPGHEGRDNDSEEGLEAAATMASPDAPQAKRRKIAHAGAAQQLERQQSERGTPLTPRSPLRCASAAPEAEVLPAPQEPSSGSEELGGGAATPPQPPAGVAAAAAASPPSPVRWLLQKTEKTAAQRMHDHPVVCSMWPLWVCKALQR